MATSRFLYRSRQFWRAAFGLKDRADFDSIRDYLSPAQLVLFLQMHPFEQRHAVEVLERLKAAGHTEPDLLTAALLHDVGKILSPLSLWERVVIVVGNRLFPGAVKRWGQGKPRGLLHPFVVAEQHPQWGADLAAQAGASPRTVSLISRHQGSSRDPKGAQTDRLLAALQAADDN